MGRYESLKCSLGQSMPDGYIEFLILNLSLVHEVENNLDAVNGLKKSAKSRAEEMQRSHSLLTRAIAGCV